MSINFTSCDVDDAVEKFPGESELSVGNMIRNFEDVTTCK